MKMEPAKSFVAEQPAIDLSKPSLRGLSHRLRRGNLGFGWNYYCVSQCAIRLARDMWGQEAFPLSVSLGITRDAENLIFGSLGMKLGVGRVTPEMVADEIDSQLARGGSAR